MAVGNPDISYAPDWEKYQARTKRRLESEKLDLVTLPEGFPKKLESSFVWEGEGLVETYQWVYELSKEQVEEIERGLVHFKCKFIFYTHILDIGNGWLIIQYSFESPPRIHNPRNLPPSHPAPHPPRILYRTPFRPRLQSPPRPPSHPAHAGRKHHHLRRRILTRSTPTREARQQIRGQTGGCGVKSY